MDEACAVDSGYFPSTKETYKGDLNFSYQRTGKGEQIWQCKSFERYQGDFFQDSLHGYGTYTWLQQDKKDFLVEGTFYASHINGYCNIACSNKTYFEGLIKKNKRFGPGVLTYLDGRQDVGLWNELQLIRICYTIFPEYLPKLTHSPLGKVRLLRFKKLIPICDKTEDVAIEILKKLGAPKPVLEISNQLYNPYIRNIDSLLFDKKLHDAQIYKETDCLIDVPASTSDFMETTSQNKIIEDNLSEMVDYLVENADVLNEIPQESRLSFMESKLLDERSDLIEIINENLIKKLLDIFLEDLDDLLKYPNEERNLILIKREILKKLPEDWKNDIPLKTIQASDILAWNNDEGSIEMLKYIFQNMKLEKNISFNVRSLLIGDRSKFSPPGDYEQSCIRFLQESSLGNYKKAAQLIVEKSVNPDVCDAKGNTAVMFASAKDKWRVIKTLCNFGADLDKPNDDGLSPLSMCILRYVAFKEDITDWEQAFLNDISISQQEKEEILQWRPHSSLVDLKAMSLTSNLESVIIQEDIAIKKKLLERESLMEDLHLDPNEKNILENYYDDIKTMNVDTEYTDFQKEYEVVPDVNQKYLFLVELKIPPVKKVKIDGKEKKNKGKDKKKEKKGKGTESTKSSKSQKIKPLPEIDEKALAKEGMLNIILTTIKLLLKLGCDPNYCFVPLPPLLIAIYTNCKDLAELLLQSGANPNIVSPSDGLTPLLLLCCLPFSTQNTELLKFLLKLGANPNQKVSANHWTEEKNKLQGKYTPEFEINSGKTPLHILSMRYDFESDLEDNQSKMVEYLLENKADLKETYLGHTSFSIAILRGNIKLIKWYIESKAVEPYAILGENMGTPLTILILKRYNNILPIETAKEVYNVLIDCNFNPLVEIPDCGNCIQFMEEEYKVKSDQKEKGKKGKKEKKEKSKKDKKGKKNPVEELKNYFLFKTKEMLQRNVLAKAFTHLRTFIILSTDPNCEIIETLINFFNLKTIEKFLQLLINRGVLLYNKLNVMVTYKFLNLMDDLLKKKDKNILIGDIFNKLLWEIIPINRIAELIEPEIDLNEDIYKVCFYCCKKLNKTLIICPNCGLVYFCSQECNKQSIKENTIHNCKFLFYDKEKQRMEEALKLGIPYKESNKLRDSLELTNDVLFNLLKRKYGASTAAEMLTSSMSGGLVIIDNLIGSCQFIQNSIEDKLGMTGKDARELSQQLGGSMVMSRVGFKDSDKGKKKRSLSELGKTSKSSEDDVESKRGGKKKKKGKDDDDDVEDKFTKGGEKKKKKGKDEEDEYKSKSTGEKKKKKGKDDDEDEDEDEDKSNKGGKKKKKGKDDDEDENKSKKGGKKKKKGKDDDEDEGHKAKREKGSSKSKEKKSDMGKSEKKSKKDKESTKKKDSITKNKKEEKIKKKITDKEKDTKKSKVSTKDKIKKSTQKESKLKVEKEEKLKPKDKQSLKTLGGTKITLDKTETEPEGDKFKEEFLIQDQYPRPQCPLSCIKYVGKKDLDLKTIPAKCQFLLEELARLFPDFDFTGIMWPFVVYCDGQLYYRFLDRIPLFLETLSTI